MRPLLPSVLLGLISGCCDTAGFLGLQKLFTSQVTGNLVLIGASWVEHREGGILGRLLAVPVFVLVVWLARLAVGALRRRGWPGLRTLLLAELALLAAFLALGVTLGPFRSQDAANTLAAGMTGVAAMAVLNVIARLWPAVTASTTAMTGTAAWLMASLAELVLQEPRPDPPVTRHTGRLAATVLAFVAGCALSAASYVAAGMWCLALPLAFAAWMAALWPRDAEPG